MQGVKGVTTRSWPRMGRSSSDANRTDLPSQLCSQNSGITSPESLPPSRPGAPSRFANPASTDPPGCRRPGGDRLLDQAANEVGLSAKAKGLYSILAGNPGLSRIERHTLALCSAKRLLPLPTDIRCSQGKRSAARTNLEPLSWPQSRLS